MNREIRKVLDNYNIPVNRITIKSSAKIIDDKVVIKDRKNVDLDKTYKYLKSVSVEAFIESY